MDKRYQVFVSSTYADLKDERRTIIQTLMEMDCIPAGMELFPAMDEEQWNFIKRIIDDCDYYLLVIGGRYGSETTEGISFTEKEYDYAVTKGLKVIALVHEKPSEIPVGKSDVNPEALKRLEAFRAKVKTGRLVKFWTLSPELPGLVALSLSKTVKTYPAVGWVRANIVASQDALTEVNQLRKANEDLAARVKELEAINSAPPTDLAPLEARFDLTVSALLHESTHEWNIQLTWKEIFGFIAPHLLTNPSDGVVKKAVLSTLINARHLQGVYHTLDDQQFQTIKLQLKALGLTKIASTGGGAKGANTLTWSLTPKGEQLMMAIRTVSKDSIRPR